MSIRPARADDAHAIGLIYNYYIAHSVITFEETLIDEKEMLSRIQTIQTSFPFLVYEQTGQILGYAYATHWRLRSAYRYAVESTVYLDTAANGKGVGTQLYQALIHGLRENNFRAVIGGIALPNPASVALHEKLGFEKVAEFKKVGFKFGQWIDVGYWQLLL